MTDRKPRPPKHVYRITYQRPGHPRKYAYKFEASAVRRYITKIRRPYPPLPAVTTIVVERAALADEWEQVPLLEDENQETLWR